MGGWVGGTYTCEEGFLDVVEESALAGDGIAIRGMKVFATQGLGGSFLGLGFGGEGGRVGGWLRP